MGIENPVHLVFIAAVALIVLGPKRLPGLARALGQGIREFRASITEGESGEREDDDEEAPEDRLSGPDQGAASDERH
jgi:sec-independent protein translocase protein TatA